MSSRGELSGYAIWVVALVAAGVVGAAILYGISALASLPGLNGDNEIVQNVSSSVAGMLLVIAIAIIGVIVAWYLASNNGW